MSNIMFKDAGINGKPYIRGQWKEFAVHDEFNVKGFFGPYVFLSNMFRVEVWLDGMLYHSVENAYQAAKFAPEERLHFMTCTPYEAKQTSIGKPMIYSRAQWDAVKVSVMRMLLIQKFDKAKHPELYEMLHSTLGKYLEETNWWHDVFWGCDLEGRGENNLGKLHMEIRDCE